MWFCDQCGLEATGGDPLAGDAPACPVHGPRWRLIRNAPCAAAVIVRDDRLLLGRRAKDPFAGEWEVPGGFVERGEHPAHAAVREVREELGIDITLTGLLGIYVERTARGEHLQVTFYEATTSATTCQPDPAEVTEWGWFPRSALPDRMAARHRLRLQDWLDGRTVPLPAGDLALGSERPAAERPST